MRKFTRALRAPEDVQLDTLYEQMIASRIKREQVLGGIFGAAIGIGFVSGLLAFLGVL